jgi:polyhydroxybutyrate depolymerase
MNLSSILKIILAAFLAYLPQKSIAEEASGCSNSDLKSGIYTMDHHGLARTYRIHVPGDYDASKPAPLVLLFHGWGGNEDEFLSDRILRHESDQRGYIVVAPRGLGSGEPDNSNNSWSFSGSTTGVDGASNAICDDGETPDYSYRSCANVKQNSCSWTQCQADDVAFSLALVREIKSRLCIDENRIYASGGSNGDTSVSATPVEVGLQIPDCRTWCTSDTGVPRVLDCRAQMGHTYDFSWSWKLVMNFFDRH